MTSRDSSSLATNRWLAVGAICIANRLTTSLNVAEKSSNWTCRDGAERDGGRKGERGGWQKEEGDLLQARE